MSVTPFLVLAAILFTIGLLGILTRRNLIMMLVSIEIMMSAANLNFLAFWRYQPNPELWQGPVFTLFTIGVAAAEAAVGLALVIAVYRHYRTVDAERLDGLKG
jgi:NADH-quinone oxidoreductase subunit K